MERGLFVFTLLWVVSCLSVYFQLINKLNEAIDLYKDAKEKNRQAILDSKAAALKLKQINESIMSQN